MVSDADIIHVPISVSELAFLQKQARLAEIGGRSSIRTAEDRQANLSEDQLVGQIGTYAGIKALFGNPFLYRVSRYYANIYRTQGDGGSDVPGANIDFKSSRTRNIEKPLLDYGLAVRARERHEHMNYILALVEIEPKPVAHLIGWASESMLPVVSEPDGPFCGAFTLRGSQLNPLMKLTWFES